LPSGGKPVSGVHQGTLAAEAGCQVRDPASCERQAIVTGTKTVDVFEMKEQPGSHLAREIARNNLASLNMVVLLISVRMHPNGGSRRKSNNRSNLILRIRFMISTIQAETHVVPDTRHHGRGILGSARAARFLSSERMMARPLTRHWS
jgi:hypothetical protein